MTNDKLDSGDTAGAPADAAATVPYDHRPPDPHTLAHWIRLQRITGIGAERGRQLLQAFGMPENIFSASRHALRQVVPERIADALLAPMDADMRAHIDRTLAWAGEPGNAVLTLADADYPASLLHIADPPLMLYVKGRIDLLRASSLAVVGSRNATAQGIADAERFSASLSRSGWTIVSGLALGIDAAAHRGGLDGPGATVAVIGTGADIVYPSRHRELAHRIAREGCIVSEYALGTRPLACNFPRRNRIISGLAKGVLVIEAAAQSGSLITARMAGEQGREVFAIPGSIHSPLSRGCHQLIREGAKLVECAQDILDELMPALRIPAHPSLPANNANNDGAESGDALLNVMGFDPADIDTLIARCGLDAPAISAILLSLEMEGRIEMLQGGQYRRLA